MNSQSDYLLQKLPDRATVYGNSRIWWSQELKRWIVTDNGLIREILNDPNYLAPDYDATPIVERLNIDLRHMVILSTHMPLAAEGERHRQLRAKFAREIAKNSAGALSAFEQAFSQEVENISTLEAETTYCLVENLLQPTTRIALMHLSGLHLTDMNNLEIIPQLFDDTASLRRRMTINAAIGAIFDQLPDGMDKDERYFRIAILALGGNTLVGSLGQSLMSVVSRDPDARLSDMDWDPEMPETGLAVVEKFADKDAMIVDCAIRSGDRLRLLLDATGYPDSTVSSYSDLFFGSGPHKCIGMAISRQIWKIVTKHLSEVSKRLTIVDARYRTNDNVFNIHDTLQVNFRG